MKDIRKISKSGIRSWCLALVLFLLSSTVAVNSPAESLKHVIVKSSSEDLDRILARVGGAIVSAGHGYYRLAVPSTTTTDAIESIGAKGSIVASDDAPVSMGVKRLAATTSAASTGNVTSSLGPLIDWYGTPARQGYTNQAASTKIRLKDALNIADGAGSGIRVAVI